MNQGLKNTLKIAAVVVPIIGLLTLIPYTQSKKQQQLAGFGLSDSNDNPIELTHSAMPADTNMERVLDITTNKRQALFYNEEPAPTIKKQQTEGFTYYIIGGSYKEEANAKKIAAAFQKKGFGASVIYTDNLYRVSLSSFDSKVNALHELRRIRNEENNEKVWLYAKK